MRRPWAALALLTLAGLPLLAQELPAGEPAFQNARPGYTFEFPRDHGSHEEFRTEWWYYTGHLRTAGGSRYGFEVTFFRVGVVPPGIPKTTAWDLHNLSLAHFALTDIERGKFRYYEKLNRSSPFTAGARTGFLDVFNEGWSVRTTADGDFHLRASANGDAIDLVLHSEKPPAINGENGISVKAAGEGYASHYYSLTRLAVEGSVVVNGKRDLCEGIAWMDHEFGSSALRENQQGWDWFSVQLDNHSELMLYQIRKSDGSPDVTSAGSLILPDGNVIHLDQDQFRITPTGEWKSPHSGAAYPMGWRIEVLPFNIALTIDEELKDQELVTASSTRVTYWEGAVRAVGSFGETPVRGAGYVELTGYARRFGS